MRPVACANAATTTSVKTGWQAKPSTTTHYYGTPPTPHALQQLEKGGLIMRPRPNSDREIALLIAILAIWLTLVTSLAIYVTSI